MDPRRLQPFASVLAKLVRMQEEGWRPRSLIPVLWELLRRAPMALSAALSRFDEAQIQDWVADFGGDPGQLMLAYDPPPDLLGDPSAVEKLAIDLITFARWIDAEALESADLSYAKLDDPEIQCRETVPIGELNWPAPAALERDYFVLATPRTGHGARQLGRQGHLPLLGRALPNHRVVPADLPGGFRARLHGGAGRDAWRAMTAHRRGADNLRFGGAVFRDLDPVATTTGKRFRVAEVRSPHYDADLEAHLDHFIRDDAEPCDAVAFPECAVPPSAAQRIQDALAGRADHRGAPAFVVAGSWHRLDRADKRRYRNLAPLYDRFGRLIAEVAKCSAYRDRAEGLIEGVTPGDEIHSVLVRGRLITPLICKDFCSRDKPTDADPLPIIENDAFCVISMGGLAAITEHAHVARGLFADDLVRSPRLPRRSFVIQQPEAPVAEAADGAPSNGAWGYWLLQTTHHLQTKTHLTSPRIRAP